MPPTEAGEEFLSHNAGFSTRAELTIGAVFRGFCVRVGRIKRRRYRRRAGIESVSGFFSFVLSGVGTRNYYRKMGYELEGPYMVKRLD